MSERSTSWRIIEGDCRDVLASLPERSVHTCVTSPPYFGLRDYGTGEWDGGDPACDHAHAPTRVVGNAPSTKSTLTTNNGAGPRPGDKFHADQRREVATECPCGARRVDRQIGLEPTPDEFVAALVDVFRDVRRVLRDDGTVWLNLGDSYAQYDGQGNLDEPREAGWSGAFRVSPNLSTVAENRGPRRRSLPPGLKRKDLVGIPWMVAFALRADGWYLRSDIIWSKPNPMPESVTDRPTKAHEYVFLLSKGPKYHYDADAIREDNAESSIAREGIRRGGVKNIGGGDRNDGERLRDTVFEVNGRNRRSVWTVATQPYAGAHFATFPPKLIEPCILAGAPERACGECGAPWVRVVEPAQTEPDLTQRSTAHYDTAERYGAGNGGNGGFDKLAAKMRSGEHGTRTLGFESSCSHDDGSASGVVLDPFVGSGTTGMVALRHGRSFVGVELSPVYAAMARWRIRDDAPLLNSVAEAA